ncbi:MAG: hypothetical protein ACWGOX_04225 [Desulforhopalus sp.]
MWLKYLTRQIPERSARTLTGSQFVDLVAKLDEQKREHIIEEQLLQGNMPRFLRKLKPVRLQQLSDNGRLMHATIFVTPDYLAIGSQDDFIRVPMDYHTATKVATQFGFILPTRRMVDAIYNQSEQHFTPQPLPPGPQMRSTGYYQRHNQEILHQRHDRGIALGQLVSGHKKDVVISNRLKSKPGRVAIYGWHRSNGKPIQPLSTVHGAGYADYSHGVRLVSDQMLVDGEIRSIYDVLKDPELASLVSDEGIMPGFHSAPERRPVLASNRHGSAVRY